MAAWDTAITAIRAQIAAAGLPVPVIFDNEGLNAPVDTTGRPTPWLYVEVVWNGGMPMSIGAPGSNRQRRQGHVWLHAFAPVGEGAVPAHQIAAQAASALECQDFGGVVCQTAEPGGSADAVGVQGSYYGQSAAIPFHFDETA